MSTINLGRVQGAGIFYSTASSGTSVAKSTLAPNGIVPLVGDSILFPNGDLRKITAVSGTNVTCGNVETNFKERPSNVLQEAVMINRTAGVTEGDMINLGYTLGLEQGKQYIVKYTFNEVAYESITKYEAPTGLPMEGGELCLCQSTSYEGQAMTFPLTLGISQYSAAAEDYMSAIQNYGMLFIVDKHQITGDMTYSDDENNSSFYVRAFQSSNAQNAVTVELTSIDPFVENVADKAINDGEGNNIVSTYAKQNGNYSDMSVGNADKLGNKAASEYALSSDIPDVSNFAEKTGTYSDMIVGKATNADNAANAEKLGNKAAEEYALTIGIYPGIIAGSAAGADTLGGMPPSSFAQINGSYSLMSVGSIIPDTENYGGAVNPYGRGSGTVGPNSTAFGNNVTAAGNGSTALGYEASAGVEGSTALGVGASAGGKDSTALGKKASAGGLGSTALGCVATSSGGGSTAVGNGASASGDYSTALGGASTSAGGNQSTALGAAASAGGEVSTAVGIGTSAGGFGSTALGRNAAAGGNQSTALGYAASAGGIGSTAVGSDATASESDLRVIQLGSGTLSVLRCQVNLTVTSDERDKADINNITNALPFLEKLNPVTFVSNDRVNYIAEEDKQSEKFRKYGMCDYDRISHALGTKKGERRRCGLLAQEVIAAMQEVYGTDNYANIVNDNFHDLQEKPSDVENKYTLAYANLVPFLIGAIKELNAKIKSLEDKLK